MNWTDKVVLITGGSAGLGRAVAQRFASRGASLVIVARGEERLEQAAEALRHAGAQVTPLVADVTEDEQVDMIIARTLDRYGRLDVLVNNVGRSARGLVTETTVDDFCNLFETNFWPAVRCTRAAIGHLEKTAGSLVNIGSLASKSVGFHLGAYPATKFALAAYTAQLRLELVSKGIHVLHVCSGPIARDDAGNRYNVQAEHLPESSHQPGAGVRLAPLSADYVARRVLEAVERRRAELVVPGKAKLLFGLSQLFPRWGDIILRKQFDKAGKKRRIQP